MLGTQLWWMGSLCYIRLFLRDALGNALNFREGDDIFAVIPNYFCVIVECACNLPFLALCCVRVCTPEQLVITDETDVP